MDTTNIGDFIQNIFDYYDKQNNKYKDYLLENIKLDVENKYFIDKNTNEIIQNISNSEILGIFYHEHNVFVWGWVLPNLKNNEIVKGLLYYGVLSNSNTNEHIFIRSILINSRIYIENDFNLQFILGLSLYLAKEVNSNFIYKTYIYDKEDKKKVIQTVFNLIKL
jgi:hypothetical protein